MREAIGGTWLFGIVITFIALFASFLAYSISYTRAFNMKSEILNIIERSEGYTTTDLDLESMTQEQLETDLSADAQIYNLIKKYGYNYTSAENIDCSTVGHPNSINGVSTMKVGGYCLTKMCPNKKTVPNLTNNTEEVISGTDSRTYYKVTTFIAITLPVVNVTLKVPITGETRTLFYDNSDHLDVPCLTDIELASMEGEN